MWSRVTSVNRKADRFCDVRRDIIGVVVKCKEGRSMRQDVRERGEMWSVFSIFFTYGDDFRRGGKLKRTLRCTLE